MIIEYHYFYMIGRKATIINEPCNNDGLKVLYMLVDNCLYFLEFFGDFLIKTNNKGF